MKKIKIKKMESQKERTFPSFPVYIELAQVYYDRARNALFSRSSFYIFLILQNYISTLSTSRGKFKLSAYKMFLINNMPIRQGSSSSFIKCLEQSVYFLKEAFYLNVTVFWATR